MSFPPMVRAMSPTGPFLGDTDSAGKPNDAVDHQDLPVGTVVGLEEVLERQRPEPGHLYTSPFESGEGTRIHGSSTDGINNEVNCHPGSSPFG